MSQPQAQLKLVPPGHCTACGQPLPKGGKRICASCSYPILKGHKFYFTERGTVHHKNCERPTSPARVDTTGGTR